MLVNVSGGGLQVDLHSPNQAHKSKTMNRPGPVCALSIKKGQAVDILPYFGGSVEKAHAAVKHSRDALRLIRPDRLHVYVSDDNGKPVDINALMGGKPVQNAPPTPAPTPAPAVSHPLGTGDDKDSFAPADPAAQNMTTEEAAVRAEVAGDPDTTNPSMESAVIAMEERKLSPPQEEAQTPTPPVESPKAPAKHHSKKELSKLSVDELTEMGVNEFGLNIADLSKKEMIEAILEAQKG